ncbi:MAG: SDR family oxidoreductase [Sphingopyxis sp.]|nr:SDR family oxidoreductase [Sphingopyxis sp.]
MTSLKGKRAVVTGAANGLGKACALAFLAEGASVVVADFDREAGERLAGEAGLPDRFVFVPCDVSDVAQLESAILTCVDRWGGIDILVNNAGIAPKANIETIDEALFDRVHAINLRAAVFGTQIAARHMAKEGKGAIINMSSVNAELNIPDLLAYNVSKGGLNQLTRNSAIALARKGIRVNGIGPGTILTKLTRDAVWTDEAARRSILSRTPMGRAGEPEEIAAIALFLASDASSYVTGQTIYADGGRMGLNYTVAAD